MRILVPFTVRHPRVEAAISAARPVGVPVVWEDVSSDGDAYWRAMCANWQGDDSLMVVEHDVEIHGDVIKEFLSCPEPWCVFGYDNICHPECQMAWANMLGCTRFRAELMAVRPHALISIPEDQRLWNNLCDSIAGNKVAGVDVPTLRPCSVRAGGFEPHWHTPPIHHISWEGHAR